MADAEQPRWLPLESNPDVMNKFVVTMGHQQEYVFTDVFGLDPELLDMVPRPVAGVLLLFPVNADYKQQAEAEAAEIAGRGGQPLSSNIYFLKQTISNACGTIGLLHCLGNNQDKITFEPGSYLDEFYRTTAPLSPAERGAHLEKSNGISQAHEASALEGQTEAPSLDEDQDLHFICFVEKEGHLYELDGNKPFPINHGPSSSETLLEDTVKVVQEFMARKPDDYRFTVVAFSKA